MTGRSLALASDSPNKSRVVISLNQFIGGCWLASFFMVIIFVGTVIAEEYDISVTNKLIRVYQIELKSLASPLFGNQQFLKKNETHQDN